MSYVCVFEVITSEFQSPADQDLHYNRSTTL